MRTITVPASLPMIQLLGHHDDVLRALEKGLAPVTIHVRGRDVHLSGSPGQVALAADFIEELIAVASAGENLTAQSVERAMAIMRSGIARPSDVLGADILTTRGRTIRPKTLGQKAYVDAIDESIITFGIGPAGTGKTYLAVAKAVVALQTGEVSRIVLSRPVVEAGESLGFLPGSLVEKIDPYMRPLYDALADMMDVEHVTKLMAAGTIELAPLAYMRGRTLNDAFVILDEAQNTTVEQMKLVLTRLGMRSRMVVTGDLTQVDLPRKQRSGLVDARHVLRAVDGIRFIELSSADTVRSRIVADIIDAYARADNE